MKKIFCIILMLAIIASLTGCIDEPSGSRVDAMNTQDVVNRLQSNQPTPSDIEYSLERYNLIRRAYWVNGMREKANSLVCEIEKPLGYIVLLTEGGAVVGSFVVDGKVSCLNSFLTPDSEYYEKGSSSGYTNKWLLQLRRKER